MWSEVKIEEYLRENLKESRYEHSLAVRDTAVKLANYYNADVEKARIAGLIHDCAKCMNDKELLDIASVCEVKIDNICKMEPQLLHGLCSSYIAKNFMGIKDKEILQSVAYHTTGKENMSLLEKIIFLADYIEPNREFNGVENLRKVAYEDINKSLLIAFDNTINYIIESRGLIHINTIKARNYLIYNEKL